MFYYVQENFFGTLIHGGVVVHLPDFLIWADPRATVRALCVPGDPMKLQDLALDWKCSHM